MSSKQNLTPKKSFFLMDDPRTAALLEEEHLLLSHFIRFSILKRTDQNIQPTVQAAKNQPLLKKSPLLTTAANIPTSKKHFSSRPDLREMMQQYNRPRPQASPLKMNSQDAQASQMDFRAERIDFIHLPSIPGRVLRPKATGSKKS